MECLVLYGAIIVGQVVLDGKLVTSEEPPNAGPTIWGPMMPTSAYSGIQVTCQALRQIMHPEVYSEPTTSATPSTPPGVIPVDSFESFKRRMKIFEAAKSLALRLTRPDGTAVPTVRVLIEDFTPTAEEGVPFSPEEAAEVATFQFVAATLPPGMAPP